MQSQERDLITGLFGRLQPFEAQPRDGEAEALIKDSIARQPAAPYLLVQAVLVQEQALKAAQERIAELEAKANAPAAAPAAGFLGSAPRLGPWGTAPAQPAAAPPARSSMVPSTRSPMQAALAPQQPMMGGAGGGGFLRTALATAAGVAGGALLFEGIRNMMGSNPGAFGPSLAQTPSPLLPPDSLPPQVPAADSYGQQQASYDDGGTTQDGYDTASNDTYQDQGQDRDQYQDDDQGQDFADNDLGSSDDDSWA
ncbi:MAG: DUF2076 domain-containing protein [Reyranellaceae bacterium]